MFENVLVGVDGAPGGRDAIALASVLAGEGATITLAHAYRGSSHAFHTASGARESRDHAEQLLASERDQAGVTAQLAPVDASSPGRGLHVEAEQRGCDLLVLGTSHRGVLGRTLLGDDTRAGLDGASCPVAVAPAGFARAPAPLRSIGVGYDGSPESEAAIELARALAQSRGAKLRALQMVAIPYYEYTGLAAGAAAETGDIAEQRVALAEKELDEIPGVEGEARYGLAGEELAALSGEVDLTIVGSRGYGPARRLLVGSTSHYLLRHARGPLLILTRGDEPAAPPGGAGA